jgi:hypothetical protein
MNRHAPLAATVITIAVAGVVAVIVRSSAAAPCTPVAAPKPASSSQNSKGQEPSISTLEQSANQLVPPPVGSTGAATAITTSAATLTGMVTARNEQTQAYFQYGTSASQDKPKEYRQRYGDPNVGPTQRPHGQHRVPLPRDHRDTDSPSVRSGRVFRYEPS